MNTQGSYDVRGMDLRQYYASWGRVALPEEAIMALSRADAMTPEHHIGFDAWIATVAHSSTAMWAVREWVIPLAPALAEMRPRRGQRARQFCEGYSDAWGPQAALDGAALAIDGERAGVPGLGARADEFSISPHTYAKIRNFIRDCVMWQAGQFEDALVWVIRTKLHGSKIDLS